MTSPPPGKELELVILKTVFGGDGFARDGGKVYFIEGALPSEKVLARVIEEKKSFSRAKIVRVLEPSPHRVDPPCRYASHCGGCQYQHVDYSEELRLKQAQVFEILAPVPGFDQTKLSPMIPSKLDYGYRNGVTLRAIHSKKKSKTSLGFISKDNVSKIPVQNCLLADPRLSVIFGKEVHFKKNTEKVTFKLSDKGEVVSDRDEAFFRVRMGEETFLTSSLGFFQNNLAVASQLAQKILGWVEKTNPKIFFDLYAGVGTFSILCAKNAEKIIAIEESAASIQAMRMNREEKKRATMEIIEGRVEKVFPKIWEKEKTASSFILLDPPRQGISADFAGYLAKNEAMEALAYVSCDPVTLARDLKIILSLKKWAIREVAPLDMFPRTKHIEVAVFLTKLIDCDIV